MTFWPQQKIYGRLRGLDDAQRIWQISEELTDVRISV